MRKTFFRSPFLVVGITCLTVCVGLAVSVADDNHTETQTIPLLIPYQGRLEFQGVPVNDAVTLNFALFPSNASESEPIWGPEAHTLTPVDGKFSVMLGKTVPLVSEDLVGGEIWVGITVQTGESHNPVELSERQRLGSVAFALNALRASIADGQLATQVVPTGMVSPFALDKCPNGWSEYEPAQGRFIRGIDPNGSIDPDGVREVGNIQGDMLRSHTHTVRRIPPGVMGDGGKTALNGDDLDTKFNNWPSPINATGGPETRPKNVALLYCRKD